ncbi:hypothetical protein [Runella sp. SP2]|uniref:hypothetical protein n=1 Tax=Runella sp. SP2 TaxID=2268026 RepID=UPI0013DDFB55|nr:hypothetical protein [Runella sp. SP2]
MYKQAQLSLHRKPQKARIREEFGDLLSPKSINKSWAMDFFSEVIIEPTQQWVRIINIVDECSRKGLRGGPSKMASSSNSMVHSEENA